MNACPHRCATPLIGGDRSPRPMLTLCALACAGSMAIGGQVQAQPSGLPGGIPPPFWDWRPDPDLGPPPEPGPEPEPEPEPVPEAPTDWPDRVSPEEVVVQGRTGMAAIRQQQGNISRRMEGLRTGLTGLDSSGLTLNLDGRPLYAGPARSTGRAGLAGGREFGNLSWYGVGAFVAGSASFSRRDETPREAGYKSRSLSLTAGVDNQFSHRTMGGIALGVSQAGTELRGDAGSLDVDGLSLSLYGAYLLPRDFHVGVVATLGRYRYDMERRFIPGDNGEEGYNAAARPSGASAALGLTLGRDVLRGPWVLSLQSGLDYVQVNIDGYDESSSDPDAPGQGSLLTLESQTATSLTLEGAAQASYAYATPRGLVMPTVRLGVEHEFDHDSRRIRAGFRDNPDAERFSIRTDGPDRTRANVGFGLSAHFLHGPAQFQEGFTSAHLFVESVEGLSDERIYQVDAGVRTEF